MEITREIK